MNDKITFPQKVKVMNKLFDNGYNTEKKLQQLDMEQTLKISGITISDMTIIMELQKASASKKLFSYLGGEADDE